MQNGCRCRGRRIVGIANVQKQVAGAVGFEPTIPDLETGALSQAKLRPFDLQNWPLDGAEPPAS